MADFVSTYGLYLAYILIGLGILLAIVLPLISAFSNPKALIGTAVGVVIIVAVFFIGWAIASNEVLPAYAEENITPASSKIIGGGLIAMYIMIGIAIVTILFSELSSIFK